MNMPGRLDLTLGPCRWENAARHVLAAAGLLIVLTTPTTWYWKLATVAMLGLTWRWSAEPRGRGEPRTILTVYADGSARVSTGGREAPVDEAPREIGGRGGLDPVRYGDWEKNGRCIDF